MRQIFGVNPCRSDSRIACILHQCKSVQVWRNTTMATRCGNYGFTFILRCLACGAIIQVETAIRDGCAVVSQTFLHLADRQKLFDGSTAVFMLRRENTIWVANIGDSRGVLLTSSSSSKPKSSSASPSCKACFMRRQIGLRCADCKQRKQTPKTTILPQTGRFRHSPEAEAAAQHQLLGRPGSFNTPTLA